jgi:GNAT superfamily N-acetyltransferase
MKKNVIFRSYTKEYKEICLSIFDANCPEFFASNERVDYEQFLESNPLGYYLCFLNDSIAGAFGLIVECASHCRLDWILLKPQVQRQGIGSSIMKHIRVLARSSNCMIVNIATSHKSAPFFYSFGALKLMETKNGWGPGMHRVDMELHL